MYYQIEDIFVKRKLVAKVFRYNNKKFSGIKFFTENNLEFQVGLMSHNAKHRIIPHSHKNHKKVVSNMSEFLIIFKGKLKVFFYDKKNKVAKTKILNKKDMLLLIDGAHGFKVINKVEMLEIKQGPFNGDKDKIKLNKN